MSISGRIETASRVSDGETPTPAVLNALQNSTTSLCNSSAFARTISARLDSSLGTPCFGYHGSNVLRLDVLQLVRCLDNAAKRLSHRLLVEFFMSQREDGGRPVDRLRDPRLLGKCLH